MLSDKEFFLKLKQYIEDVEHQIDGEWGNCRSVEQLISDGAMPDLYFQVLQRITSVAPPEPVWTEGICGDGAAILKDGVMQPIEDVIAALNATSLAQSEPEGVTDEELLGCMLKAAASVPGGQCTDILDWDEDLDWDEEAIAAARAVLARWGHPSLDPQ